MRRPGVQLGSWSAVILAMSGCLPRFDYEGAVCDDDAGTDMECPEGYFCNRERRCERAGADGGQAPGPDAGADGGQALDAGADAGRQGDGGTIAPDGGVVVPAPAVALRWEPPPREVPITDACAGAKVVLLSVDATGNPAPAPTDRTVSVALEPSSAGTWALWPDVPGACASTGASTLDVRLGPSMAPRVEFLVRAGVGSSAIGLVARDSSGSGPLLSQASVQLNPVHAGLSVAPSVLPPIEYGGCVGVNVQRVSSANVPLTMGVNRGTVSVAGDAGALSVHADRDCSGGALDGGAWSIDDGKPGTAIYLRGRSAAPTTDGGATEVNLTLASDSLAAPTGPVRAPVLPLVRRGQCTMLQSMTDVSCPVSPPLPNGDVSRTFLAFQATSAETSADAASVACELRAPSATNPLDVHCRRLAPGQGVSGPVTVSWQTASWGRPAPEGGVTVQHRGGFSVTITETGTDFAITNTPSILESSFLLFSSAFLGSPSEPYFGPHFVIGSLDSQAQQVNFTTSPGAGSQPIVAWLPTQVVTMAGALVRRGLESVATTSAPDALTFQSSAQIDSSRAILLHSVGFSDVVRFTSWPAACRHYLGWHGSSGMRFTRTLSGTSACDAARPTRLSWEQVQLPAGSRVHQVLVTLAFREFERFGAPPTSFVPHRTLLLLSGQGLNGQASGKGGLEYGLSPPGEATARVEPQPSSCVLEPGGPTCSHISVARGAADGGAEFNVFVAEFPP